MTILRKKIFTEAKEIFMCFIFSKHVYLYNVTNKTNAKKYPHLEKETYYSRILHTDFYVFFFTLGRRYFRYDYHYE